SSVTAPVGRGVARIDSRPAIRPPADPACSFRAPASAPCHVLIPPITLHGHAGRPLPAAGWPGHKDSSPRAMAAVALDERWPVRRRHHDLLTRTSQTR